MYIDSLDYEGWRGASFRLKFSRGVNALVGMNGCGKTNTLELIAILAGHRQASQLLREGDELKYARIVLFHNSGSLHDDMHVLTLGNGLDHEKIAEFKDRLPVRPSFILQQDSLRDDRFVTERREPVECQESMLRWLKDHDLGVNFHMKNGEYASLLVSETGAQRYLLTVGMRRAPTATPMLIEHPERSLHIMLKRRLPSFYRETKRQQLIMTTHDPEVLSGVDSGGWSSHREYENKAIDMHDKAVKW